MARHAIAAFGETDNPEVIERLSALLGEGGRAAPSAAVILAQQGKRGAQALLAAVGHPGSRTWAAVGLGRMPDPVVREAAGGDLSAELEAVLRPMWAVEEGKLASSRRRPGGASFHAAAGNSVQAPSAEGRKDPRRSLEASGCSDRFASQND